MKNPLFSRLARKQQANSFRQALIFGILSLFLISIIIFLGIPSLIKIAVFLGNIKSSYLPAEVEDNIPPVAPRLSSVPQATFSAEININGFAESGSIVELFLSGFSEQKTVVETDGTFLISNLGLIEGRNEIYATATDKAGNISQPSEKVIVVFDNTPPKLTILQPENNSTFYEIQKRIEIKGETEENASLKINDHLVIIDSQGKFIYPFNLSFGENKIRIVAEDKAGNQIEEELTITLE